VLVLKKKGDRSSEGTTWGEEQAGKKITALKLSMGLSRSGRGSAPDQILGRGLTLTGEGTGGKEAPAGVLQKGEGRQGYTRPWGGGGGGGHREGEQNAIHVSLFVREKKGRKGVDFLRAEVGKRELRKRGGGRICDQSWEKGKREGAP